MDIITQFVFMIGRFNTLRGKSALPYVNLGSDSG